MDRREIHRDFERAVLAFVELPFERVPAGCRDLGVIDGVEILPRIVAGARGVRAPDQQLGRCRRRQRRVVVRDVEEVVAQVIAVLPVRRDSDVEPLARRDQRRIEVDVDGGGVAAGPVGAAPIERGRRARAGEAGTGLGDDRERAVAIGRDAGRSRCRRASARSRRRRRTRRYRWRSSGRTGWWRRQGRHCWSRVRR